MSNRVDDKIESLVKMKNLNFRKDKQKADLTRRSFLYELVVTTVVLLLPFAIYLHLLFNPETDQITIFGIEIIHNYPDNRVFAWFVISSFINLVFAVLIFVFTVGYWKYSFSLVILHSILYPFWMFSDYQLGYFNYIISLEGIIIISIVLFILFYLDRYISLTIIRHSIKPSSTQYWKELMSSKSTKFLTTVEKILKEKSKVTLKEYCCRIYYYLIISEYSYGYERISVNRPITRSNIIHNLLRIIPVLILTSFLFAHLLIPDNQLTIRVAHFEFGTFGFIDVGTLVYYASNKLVYCLLLIIWFSTSVFWWRWAILSPIIFYAYQFWESFQPVSEIDGAGNIKVFPLVFITIFGVLLLSKIIRRISINLDYQALLREEFNRSLEELSRTPDYRIH